jgi:hypothetical protein
MKDLLRIKENRRRVQKAKGRGDGRAISAWRSGFLHYAVHKIREKLRSK